MKALVSMAHRLTIWLIMREMRVETAVFHHTSTKHVYSSAQVWWMLI